MLSFLKLVQNWPKLRFWIWRSAVVPYDGTEKNRNIGAQLQFILLTTAKNILENLLPVWLLVHTNLFVPSHFWTPDAKFDMLLALYSEMWNKFYIGAHLRSLLQSTAVDLFWNLSDIYMKWCAQTSQPIFLNFSQFLTAISRKLWHYLATETGTIYSFWKGNDFRKKSCKNQPINRDTIVAQTMYPSDEQRSGLGAWYRLQKKEHSDKHHIFAPTPAARCALYDLPQYIYPRRSRSAIGVDIVLTLDVCLYVC